MVQRGGGGGGGTDIPDLPGSLGKKTAAGFTVLWYGV